MTGLKVWLGKVWNFLKSIWAQVPDSVKGHVNIEELKNVIIFAVAVGVSGGGLGAVLDYFQGHIAVIIPDVLTNTTLAAIVAGIFNYIRVWLHGSDPVPTPTPKV